jgi:2-polyprenyl-3-methyl-5-hydroxy-6-metoxy-1,4-benzoquinol methylase
MKKAQISTLNHQYRDKVNSLTPFEIYLKHSNEKDVSTKQLNKILSKIEKTSLKILDVGSGDGTYLLESLPEDKDIKIKFVEPSKELFIKLKHNTKSNSNYKCVSQTFEEFYKINNEKFDIVLASHLYHFTQEEYPLFISQLITLLNDSGVLIWIERGIDEIAEFKKKFKTKLLPNRYPDKWQPRNYKRALSILKEKSVNTKLLLNSSELKFPYKENLEETIAIVDFYLNIDWISIPELTQKEILEYISTRKGILQQQEGVIIYKKK